MLRFSGQQVRECKRKHSEGYEACLEGGAPINRTGVPNTTCPYRFLRNQVAAIDRFDEYVKLTYEDGNTVLAEAKPDANDAIVIHSLPVPFSWTSPYRTMHCDVWFHFGDAFFKNSGPVRFFHPGALRGITVLLICIASLLSVTGLALAISRVCVVDISVTEISPQDDEL